MATTKKTTAKKTATTKKTTTGTSQKTTTKKTATKSPVEIITPDIVGTSAGKIWNTLNGSEKALTERELLSLTKLSGQSLYLGLGWLARQGKLESDGKGFKLVYKKR